MRRLAEAGPARVRSASAIDELAFPALPLRAAGPVRAAPSEARCRKALREALLPLRQPRSVSTSASSSSVSSSSVVSPFAPMTSLSVLLSTSSSFSSSSSLPSSDDDSSACGRAADSSAAMKPSSSPPAALPAERMRTPADEYADSTAGSALSERWLETTERNAVPRVRRPAPRRAEPLEAGCDSAVPRADSATGVGSLVDRRLRDGGAVVSEGVVAEVALPRGGTEARCCEGSRCRLARDRLVTLLGAVSDPESDVTSGSLDSASASSRASTAATLRPATAARRRGRERAPGALLAVAPRTPHPRLVAPPRPRATSPSLSLPPSSPPSSPSLSPSLSPAQSSSPSSLSSLRRPPPRALAASLGAGACGADVSVEGWRLADALLRARPVTRR